MELLRPIETPDLGDYEPHMTGEKTLGQLRKDGVDTGVLKKVTPNEHGVGVELHDRSGESLDRVCDRTYGKPIRRQQHAGSLVPLAIEITTLLDGLDK